MSCISGRSSRLFLHALVRYKILDGTFGSDVFWQTLCLTRACPIKPCQVKNSKSVLLVWLSNLLDAFGADTYCI